MKKHTLTSKLTKSQKFMIIFWGLYELIMGIIVADEGYNPFRLFLILSIPCILYWSGAWIWGFGYLFKLLPKRSKNISRNVNKNLERTNGEFPKGSLYLYLEILTFIILFCAGFLFQPYKSDTLLNCIGSGIGYMFGCYFLAFCLTWVFTIFIKDKQRKKKVSICFVFLFAILFAMFHRPIMLSNREAFKETNGQLVNLISKSINNESSNTTRPIPTNLIRDCMNMMINYNVSIFPEKLSEAGFIAILTKDRHSLIQSKEGLKQLHNRGQKIITKIDNIDPQKFVQDFSSQMLDEIQKECFIKYPIDHCKLIVNAINKKLKKQIDINLQRFLNRKDAIHAEFNLIECSANLGLKSCASSLSEYKDKVKKVENQEQEIQQIMKENALEILK